MQKYISFFYSQKTVCHFIRCMLWVFNGTKRGNSCKNVQYENFGSFIRVKYDRLNTGQGALTGQYGGQEQSDAQFFFDYNLRNELGLDPFGTDFVNIDNVDPNILSFEMFSPDELFNSGNNYVQYWGYDHTGTKTNGVTDIDKYFTEFDDNGNYKRSIGAFQPIYVAGYIMDKFSFEDIVFNVGVRVDMFDANPSINRKWNKDHGLVLIGLLSFVVVIWDFLEAF